MIENSLKYIIYFILGGLIVVFTTYFGSEKKGLIAAIIALFPFILAFTQFTIYSTAGLDALTSYVRELLLFIPVLILYLVCILYLLPRYGFWFSLTFGTIIYIIFAVILVSRF